ncbi:MAG: 50S ribosomal protein L22 [Bacillota bacterium]|jgi:large subunit ribosomal protein L22|nr:MAG: 50S ribosomal protein L22 [Bacillota bacterium]
MARTRKALADEARATARFAWISPRKVRIVLDLVRGKSVDEALNMLKFLPKRASTLVAKAVRSAAANAEQNYDMKRENLVVSQAFADGGPTFKRYQPRQRGRAFEIKQRTTHVTVVVREREQ